MKYSIKTALAAIILSFSSSAMAADTGNTKNNPDLRKATFAAGCFWCIVKPFKVKGVVSVFSGYAGGSKESATYKQVSAGKTRHREAVQVTYDPKVVKYQTLLDIYWKNVDPFDSKGQFCDKGFQYTSAIFTHNGGQKKLALKSEKAISQKFKGKKIATVVEDYVSFYKAEEYHQNYYKKNPLRYKFYRTSCGRDARLKAIWK